jgi:hypothetical protein
MLEWKNLVSRGCNKETLTKCCKFLRFGLHCVPALLLTTLWASPLAPQANEGAPASSPQSLPENAAPAPRPTPAHPAYSTHRRATLDDRVKALSKALDLSDPQQVAVKRILEQRQAEILRLRQDGSISGEERIGRLRAVQDQTVLRIRAVLNDDQKKKYNPLAVREITPPQGQKTVEEWLKETTPKTAPAQHQ